MPNLGSLTQRPRQPTRFGANTTPMGTFGMTRMASISGEEFITLGPLLVPNGGIGHRNFSTPRLKAPQFFGSFLISGVTRDSAGSPFGGCVVDLFLTAEDTLVASTVSDGSGAYSFSLSGNSQTYFVRAYKAGSPDVAGTSLNTLTAVSP